jgi:hypothetical protein
MARHDSSTNRAPIVGETVDVHRNLKTGLWSVSKGGKVFAELESIALCNATPRYWANMCDKIYAEKSKRRVCAWFRGTVCSRENSSSLVEVCFDPRRAPTFTTRDGRVVTHCDYVEFNPGKTSGAAKGVKYEQ